MANYTLKDGKSIYCVDNLEHLKSDFNSFQIVNGKDSAKEVCVKRFEKEREALSDKKKYTKL